MPLGLLASGGPGNTMFAQLLVVDDADSFDILYMLKLKVQPDIWAPLKSPSKPLMLFCGFWAVKGVCSYD